MHKPGAWQQIATMLTASSTPTLDAQLLIAHVLRCSRAQVLAMDRALTAREQQALSILVARRQAGEPLAYLLGSKDFYQATLSVDKRVLVPRPETELLVEQVLALPLPSTARLIDLGTGSGAIAIALAQARPDWSLIASDVMVEALAVAQHNIDRCQLQERIQCYHARFYAGLPAASYAAVVSNPPYIAEDDPHLVELAYEPRSALASPEAGFYHLRKIIEGATSVLMPGGYIAVEHGYQQKEGVHRLLEQSGYRAVKTFCDISGLDRVTIAQYDR